MNPASAGASSRPRADAPADAPSRIDQRGPIELGRNAIVAPHERAPAGWEDVRRFPIGPSTLADPTPAVEALRAARHRGESLVFELDPALAGHFGPLHRPDQSERTPVHQLDPGFTFWLDELHALVFRNSFDGRDDNQPVVEIPEVWLDYGPLRYLPPVDGIPVVQADLTGRCTAETRVPLSNDTDADLAPDQRAAVTHNRGSARIIAPAGSGKTRVLTERVRHLITQWRLPPESICLVAFNKRAQVEMTKRTSDLDGLQVRTLNSLALAILNGVPPFAPQTKRVSTIGEVEVRRLLDRFVKRPPRLNVDPMAVWIDALSSIRLGLRSPEDVEMDYGGDVSGLADVYQRFIDALRQHNQVDFDQQIVAAIEVLLRDPAARRRAQEVCRVLLVDEFQDLTPAHLLMIRILSGPLGSVFGVGDDDQTIYGYNGADPSWLIDFDHWFPGAGDHPLEVNYRCPGGIVTAADRLLRHNRHRVAKVIRPAPDAESGGWRAVAADDPVTESVAAIQGSLDAGRSPGDIAVLTRVNTTLAPVQVALNIAGISVDGGVGSDYVERTAVRASFAWLRLASAEILDADDLQEAVRRPSRKLHPRVRDWVAEQADIDGLRRLAGRLSNERDADSVEGFIDDLERLRGMERRQVGAAELLRHLIDEIGLGSAVSTLDAGRRGTNRAAQGDDLQALGQLADLYDRFGDGSFETWLRSHLATPRSDQGVVMSTVHRVKGQEWPVVIIHMADDDQFPHRLSENDEEERRLFHVALTRASREAVIVSGKRPSSVVDELTNEPAPLSDDPDNTDASRRAGARSTPAKDARRTGRSGRQNAPVHPLAEPSTVLAAVGVALVDQGQEWVIESVDESGVTARRGKITRRFAFGSKVVTPGRQRGQLIEPPSGLKPATIRAFDALRVFRERARSGKPAYVVFDDKTLVGIATALPGDLDELTSVSGVGPAKLEQYGDAVLEVIADSDPRGSE